MEQLVREMQDPENGIPIRSQKLFLTSIPSAFMGKSFTMVQADIKTQNEIYSHSNFDGVCGVCLG